MKRSFISLTVAVALCVLFAGCKKDEDTTLKGITFSEVSKMLKPTETHDIVVSFFPISSTDTDLEWTSSDEDVATVVNGKITAINVGTTVIKAISANNAEIYAECSIEVTLADFGTQSGAVEGVWTKHSIVYINDQIWVEQGKKLTVEEGVTIIIQDGPVGTSQAPIEFFVEGSLYLKGTKDYPILVTVAANKRTAENRYAGLWGGFVGGDNFSELLFDNVTIEYTGAMCRSGSQSVLKGGLNVADKDQTAQILTNNPNGKIVIINSTFRYAASDAMYFMGGQAIVANNIIHTIGENDNDGINMKAGVKVDIAYNLTFSVNSNGMKLSSSGQSPARHQAMIKAYNNTIVNSGWRRTKNLKGGSIFLEKGALAYVYNNLILNSKFMTKTPKLNQPDPDNGADHNSFVGHNFYASGTQQAVVPVTFGVSIPTAFAGYTFDDEDYWHDGRNDTPKIDETSLVATAPGSPNPNFVNFPNTVALEEDMYDPSWDFHVQAGSPVLVGANGKTPRSTFTGDFAPYFGAVGLTIDGKEYKSPAPSARYGAFGTK